MLPAVTAAPAQLIPIDVRPLDGEDVQTVDARTLYDFLGARDRFATWIEEQIARARLVKGRDYFGTSRKTGLPGRPRIDYDLTLDAAKHVSMLSGTERGHEAREYFIACERRLKAVVAAPLRMAVHGRSTPAVLLRLLTQNAERTLVLERSWPSRRPRPSRCRALGQILPSR